MAWYSFKNPADVVKKYLPHAFESYAKTGLIETIEPHMGLVLP